MKWRLQKKDVFGRMDSVEGWVEKPGWVGDASGTSEW